MLRLPAALERRLEPILEIQAGRCADPAVVLVIWLFFAAIGLYPSPLGHLDTTPYLWTALPFVGAFNPYLGFSSAVVFAAFDWAGKWISPLVAALESGITSVLPVGFIFDVIHRFLPLESVYGGNWNNGAGNFFGARIGYLVGYSGILVLALLPGILSRVARLGVYGLLRRTRGNAAATASIGL